MAEFLKNAPNALETLVHYEILQQKSKNDAFKSVVKTLVGVKEALELEIMTRQMGDLDIHDRKEKLSPNSIRNDHQSIHYCILYEFVKRKPIGQAYKSICTVLGKDVIDFTNFKFLFEKFRNGKFDMKDEEEIEEKDGATKMGPTLGDMPVEVAEKIVENLDLMDRLILRKVSCGLRSVVDSLEVHCDRLEISFADRLESVQIDSYPSIDYYYWHGNKCRLAFNGKQKVIDSDHASVAFGDLASFMRNPKFKLRNLKMIFLLGVSFGLCRYDDIPMSSKMKFVYLREFFRGLGTQLHVSSLNVEFEIHDDNLETEPVTSILPYLKPGVLEKIRIKMDFAFEEMVQKVIGMDQWKQAVELNMRRAHYTAPLEHLLGFRKFEVFVPELTDDECVRLVKDLFKAPNFESCELHCYDDELDTYYIHDCLQSFYIEDSDALYKSPHSESIFEIILSDDVVRVNKQTI